MSVPTSEILLPQTARLGRGVEARQCLCVWVGWGSEGLTCGEGAPSPSPSLKVALWRSTGVGGKLVARLVRLGILPARARGSGEAQCRMHSACAFQRPTGSKLQVHAGEYERGMGRVRGAGVLSSWGIARPAPPSPPTSLLPLRHATPSASTTGTGDDGRGGGRQDRGRGGARVGGAGRTSARTLQQGGGLAQAGDLGALLTSVRDCERERATRQAASEQESFEPRVYNVETGFAVESRSTPVLSSL